MSLERAKPLPTKWLEDVVWEKPQVNYYVLLNPINMTKMVTEEELLILDKNTNFNGDVSLSLPFSFNALSEDTLSGKTPLTGGGEEIVTEHLKSSVTGVEITNVLRGVYTRIQ